MREPHSSDHAMSPHGVYGGRDVAFVPGVKLAPGQVSLSRQNQAAVQATLSVNPDFTRYTPTVPYLSRYFKISTFFLQRQEFIIWKNSVL